jgi:hypothetical protein
MAMEGTVETTAYGNGQTLFGQKQLKQDILYNKH